MVSTEPGANEAPKNEGIPGIGGDKPSESATPNDSPVAVKTGGRSRRSPIYAEFEQLNMADAETEIVGEEEEVPDSELTQEFENLVSSFSEGQIIAGSITEIRENEIIVDVGFKSEGTIPVSEFRDFDQITPGDSVDVFLEKLENQDGLVVLSKEKADFFKVWDQIKDGYDNSIIMDGRVARRIKGGLVVDLLGVDAFLPGSQIALRQVPNLDDLIGQTLNFKIIKINKRRRNIVVSRRIVLEQQRAEQKKTLLGELEVGQVREGVVKNITDFGAFVDLGGVDGLLHLTDMTWGRIGHPSEIVSIGDEINVKVLDFDSEKEKISLGLKQLTPHPWEGVDERYVVNEKVQGKVVSITDYGAFVELEKGVEGLIHISEMSWTRHVKHPSKILSISETVEAVVLKVDKEHQKISLGLKQVEPDPWSLIEDKYPIGTKLEGKVRNLTNFGAFVEIEEGIDGLLHISDMSWAKRVRHPSEMLKKGDEIEVIVLDISQDKKRISLGMKQLQENPWESLAKEFAVDTVTQGTITRILERGAVVELRPDVEGFVPLGQMAKPDLRHPEDCYALGDTLPLKVIKVDPKNKRIVLSVSAYLKGVADEELNEFHERFPIKERPAEEAAPEEIDTADADAPTQDEAAATEPEPEQPVSESAPEVQDAAGTKEQLDETIEPADAAAEIEEGGTKETERAPEETAAPPADVPADEVTEPVAEDPDAEEKKDA
ncbi:MAG: 30S ribosomal protein S1 [Candidatus Latescibacterota bacterium]|nr:MAG: 30S ribosomal protein S1 [Candidatus Latescibacterota bacterium]